MGFRDCEETVQEKGQRRKVGQLNIVRVPLFTQRQGYCVANLICRQIELNKLYTILSYF